MLIWQRAGVHTVVDGTLRAYDFHRLRFDYIRRTYPHYRIAILLVFACGVETCSLKRKKKNRENGDERRATVKFATRHEEEGGEKGWKKSKRDDEGGEKSNSVSSFWLPYTVVSNLSS